MTTEREPVSFNAAFKVWNVVSGKYTPEPDSEHWGFFWEPLPVELPEDAKANCIYTDTIVFYDRPGNKRLAECKHSGLMGGHPQILRLAGKFREVVAGRAMFHEGRWFMRWSVATNTRTAIALNNCDQLN